MYQKPSRQLDMAYDAYLRNPGAAGQVLQAAAQGAPVGLQGLAAAAAQRTAQQDQLAQAGAQRQPPAPTIIQQLAAQPGIMGQLPSNIDLAQAPVEPAPQMMAGGGLVAFSDGGNVLPPDVIDAIQSHFASGGEIDTSEALRRAMGYGLRPEAAQTEMEMLENLIAGQRIPMGMEESLIPKYQGESALSRADELNALRNKIAGQRIPMGMEEAAQFSPSARSTMTAGMSEAAAKGIPELSMTDKLAGAARSFNPEPYIYEGGAANYPTGPRTMERMMEVRGMSPEASAYANRAVQGLSDLAPLEEAASKGVGYLSKAKPLLKAGAKYLPGVGGALTAYDVYSMATDPEKQEALREFPEAWKREMPAWLGGEPPAMSTLSREDFAPTGLYKPEVNVDDQGKKIPEAKSWKPAPETATGTPIVPKAQVIKEGSNVAPEFKAAKNDTGSAPVHEEPKAGLEALDYGAMRDLIAELRGHQTMSPEIAQKLEDLQSGAKTSTIFQTLLGGLAGGLSSPYGGRFALGRAALGALGGYEKGSAGEEAIDKSAFDILKGYAEAPQAEKAKAADLMLGIMGKSAEQQSEERRALARASSGLSYEERLALKEAERRLGPSPYQQGQQELARATQNATNVNRSLQAYNEWLNSEGIGATREQKEKKRLEFDIRFGVEGAGTQPSGLGSGTLRSGIPILN